MQPKVPENSQKGEPVAVHRLMRVVNIAKALIALLRERWVVKIKGRPDLEVKENILDHEYNT